VAIKYGKGSGQSADTVTDPQKLFQALPSKAKKYAYLRDVQGDVLAKWHGAPKSRDTIIKMNTGGGKTTVGLLLLKACLNEGVGPAVYVAPDHYLCSQVEKEAVALGLSTVKDPRSPDFKTGRAILVVPVHVLFNGMSKFGVGSAPDSNWYHRY
jgi:superfamily II DNA or RNA helicase